MRWQRLASDGMTHWPLLPPGSGHPAASADYRATRFQRRAPGLHSGARRSQLADTGFQPRGRRPRSRQAQFQCRQGRRSCRGTGLQWHASAMPVSRDWNSVPQEFVAGVARLKFSVARPKFSVATLNSGVRRGPRNRRETGYRWRETGFRRRAGGAGCRATGFPCPATGGGAAGSAATDGLPWLR